MTTLLSLCNTALVRWHASPARGLWIVIALLLCVSGNDVQAQPPSVKPAFGVVRPLVIHAVNCRLHPILPIDRPGCEEDRVLRRRERYFNVAQDEKLDIVVRQLESIDGTLGLASDTIGLATVPLDSGSKTNSVETSSETVEASSVATHMEPKPTAGSLQDSDKSARTVRLDPGQGEVVEVQVDVKSIPSGEYRGILAAQITAKDGGSETVPVPITLRVKDYFLLPLIVLLIGIVVGLWVSSYVSRKKDIDEIIIQSDQLQHQVEIEPQFHEHFRTKIENHLRNVLFDIRRNNIEQARQHLSSAFLLWDKWRMRPREWVKLFEDVNLSTG